MMIKIYKAYFENDGELKTGSADARETNSYYIIKETNSAFGYGTNIRKNEVSRSEQGALEKLYQKKHNAYSDLGIEMARIKSELDTIESKIKNAL